MFVPKPAQPKRFGVRSGQHFHRGRILTRSILILSSFLLAAVISLAYGTLASSSTPRDDTAAPMAGGQKSVGPESRLAGPEAVDAATKDSLQQSLKPSDVNPVTLAAAQQAVEPVPTPPVIPRVVRSDAVLGEPYGAAQLTIPMGIAPEWRADQPITVRAAGDRLLFPCHAIRRSDEGDELIVRFLFRGRDQLVVDVESSDGALVKKQAVRVDDDGAGHKTLLTEWWANYTDQLIEGPSEELSEVGFDVAAILGHRLGLALPSPRQGGSTRSSDLEMQFERSVSMLFGFESVRLAMMKDAAHVEAAEGPAVHALPRSIGLRAAPIPLNVPSKVSIEALASHVPQECFYLRCRSFQNYLWLRGLVMGWGGSLDEMVATPVVEHRVRERIERQLCLDPALALKLELDESLHDFGLVGGDTYFAEGAAVGVLMLARNSVRVQAILDQMRHAVAKNGGAEHRTLIIGGREISVYETPDNAIRSFHVKSGGCHLVTNSRRLAERFLACDQGKNMGSLPEFRYARSKSPATRDLTCFLYLSDAFFRNLTSPATRIEAARRRRSAAELRRLSLARLICAAEGLKGDSISDLVEHRLLPPEFGKRADGSSPVWTSDGRLVDSLRGLMGTFLPIADVAVRNATQAEVDAYMDFTRQYLREWQAMDPVMVAMHRQPTADPRDERVDLEITITPYARNAYDFLARYLATPSEQRVKAPEEDVMTLTSRLSGQTTYDVCAGIRDIAVPFRIEKGSLVKEGVFKEHSFAHQRSYAAVTPVGTTGLSLLGQFVKSLKSREIDSSNQVQQPKAVEPARYPLWLVILESTINFRANANRFAFARIGDGLELLRNGSALLDIDSIDKWTLMAHDGALRHEVSNDIDIEYTSPASQIQFRVRDIDKTKVGPYLHAVSWEAGRRLSGENAVWLTRFAATTKLDLPKTRDQVEQLLGGELRCPLGGTYELRREEATTYLASTAWGHSSRFDETAVPANYRLPFLAWLRGLNLDFQLSSTTLTSRIELHVDPTVVRDIVHAGGDVAIQRSVIDAVAAAERKQSYERLLTADRQLHRGLDRLDPSGAWTIYLAVPADPPQADDDWKKLRSISARFQLVATDPKYQVITNVNGFADTRSQLEDCLRTLKSGDDK